MANNSTNKVFIATSIDGFIADENGGVDWLNSIPNPDQENMGYDAFINSIDAIVMGRNTYELVISFDIEWPYKKPVFVLSTSINELPKELENKVEIIQGKPSEILKYIHAQGYFNLYIDGGVTIQQFMNDDLIDEMIITQMPIVLGRGIPLFANLTHAHNFKLLSSQVFLNTIVQNHYCKKN